MTASRWDPEQYLRFADERTRPLRDLLARVPALTGEPDPVILDIGCGPGNSTAVLRERWPEARITGVDNSPEMLATARTQGEPTADYVLADARTYDPATAAPDLIVSNATLQWIDGHRALLPTWSAALKAGGSLAFQVPGNFGSPSHTLLAALIAGPGWKDLIGETLGQAGVHEPGEYLQTLAAAHCTVDVWETTYSTLLPGPDPVLEWVKGTALRPVLTRLTDPRDQQRFLAEYGALLRDAYPAGPYGTVFPFRRIFAVATRR